MQQRLSNLEIYRQGWRLSRKTRRCHRQIAVMKLPQIPFLQYLTGNKKLGLNWQLKRMMLLRVMYLSLESSIEPLEVTRAQVESRRELVCASTRLCERWISRRATYQFGLEAIGCSAIAIALIGSLQAWGIAISPVWLLGIFPLWMFLLEQSRLLFCRTYFLDSVLAVEDGLRNSQQVLTLNLQLTQGRSLYRLANLLIPWSWGLVTSYFLGIPVLLLPTVALSSFLTEAGLVWALVVNLLAILGLFLWVDSRYFQPFWLAVQIVAYRDWRSQHWIQG